MATAKLTTREAYDDNGKKILLIEICADEVVAQ